MIKPTVGRVVLFHPYATDTSHAQIGEEPHAALIAAVWSDTCINIAAFDANGVPYGQTSVLLWQEGNPKPDSGYAEWMGYQIGQAKKHGEFSIGDAQRTV